VAKSKQMTRSATVPNRLSTRTEKALKRLADLTAKYVAEGLSPEDAKKRAMDEMRDNGRQDWRAG
jgi:hypothetical protein